MLINQVLLRINSVTQASTQHKIAPPLQSYVSSQVTVSSQYIFITFVHWILNQKYTHS